MYRILAIFLVSVGVLLVASAGLASAASSDDPRGDSATNSYIIIGVHPGNLMIQVTEAKLTEDGKIRSLVNRFKTHLYRPNQDGFVVEEVKPGRTYVIESASMMAGHSIFGVRFAGGDKLMAFDVPPGRVVYVASLDAKMAGGPVGYNSATYTLSEHYYQDIDGTKAYLTRSYPQLAEKLEAGRSKLVEWW
jgi:hypothetical protein